MVPCPVPSLGSWGDRQEEVGGEGTAWTQVQSLVEELRSCMPYGVAKKGGKMSRGLPQELPHKDENFIISRKKLFLRESHVSWERQHHLKTLPFMDTEKQRIFA